MTGKNKAEMKARSIKLKHESAIEDKSLSEVRLNNLFDNEGKLAN